VIEFDRLSPEYFYAITEEDEAKYIQVYTVDPDKTRLKLIGEVELSWTPVAVAYASNTIYLVSNSEIQIVELDGLKQLATYSLAEANVEVGGGVAAAAAIGKTGLLLLAAPVDLGNSTLYYINTILRETVGKATVPSVYQELAAVGGVVVAARGPPSWARVTQEAVINITFEGVPEDFEIVVRIIGSDYYREVTEDYQLSLPIGTYKVQVYEASIYKDIINEDTINLSEPDVYLIEVASLLPPTGTLVIVPPADGQAVLVNISYNGKVIRTVNVTGRTPLKLFYGNYTLSYKPCTGDVGENVLFIEKARPVTETVSINKGYIEYALKSCEEYIQDSFATLAIKVGLEVNGTNVTLASNLTVLVNGTEAGTVTGEGFNGTSPLIFSVLVPPGIYEVSLVDDNGTVVNTTIVRVQEAGETYEAVLLVPEKYLVVAEEAEGPAGLGTILLVAAAVVAASIVVAFLIISKRRRQAPSQEVLQPGASPQVAWQQASLYKLFDSQSRIDNVREVFEGVFTPVRYIALPGARDVALWSGTYRGKPAFALLPDSWDLKKPGINEGRLRRLREIAETWERVKGVPGVAEILDKWIPDDAEKADEVPYIIFSAYPGLEAAGRRYEHLAQFLGEGQGLERVPWPVRARLAAHLIETVLKADEKGVRHNNLKGRWSVLLEGVVPRVALWGVWRYGEDDLKAVADIVRGLFPERLPGEGDAVMPPDPEPVGPAPIELVRRARGLVGSREDLERFRVFVEDLLGACRRLYPGKC